MSLDAINIHRFMAEERRAAEEAHANAARMRQVERIRAQVEVIEAEVRALRALLDEETRGGNDDAASLPECR